MLKIVSKKKLADNLSYFIVMANNKVFKTIMIVLTVSSCL